MSTPPAQHAKILIADDQADVLTALRLLLKNEGYEVVAAKSPAEVTSLASSDDFDAALIDLNYTRDTTSGREGLALLESLRTLDPTLPVIVMTAWGSVAGAVEAMRRGARDYVQKPWENERLLVTLRNQVELAGALRRSERLSEENRLLRGAGAPPMIAASRAMQPVLDVVERVAASDASVLITGEHGTGKEVLARWLHAKSSRAAHPLVTVNAGGLSDGVFESELFGHVKGAFTDAKANRVGSFEVADRGTLFLDELGNMPLPQQAKLLRVLQTGELHRVGSSKTVKVDVRLVTATNADLQAEVQGGTFREDLLYRVNTVEVRIPPLRDRREDIPHLAAFFLEQTVARYHKRVEGFSDAALQSLQEHPWPGNVRELQHAVERAVLMARGERVEREDLGLRGRGAGQAAELEQMSLDDVERHMIRAALARCNGNVTLAAEQLGLSRSALYRRLDRHRSDAGE
jgi:DNA-binding NtrC family response regulator